MEEEEDGENDDNEMEVVQLPPKKLRKEFSMEKDGPTSF